MGWLTDKEKQQRATLVDWRGVERDTQVLADHIKKEVQEWPNSWRVEISILGYPPEIVLSVYVLAGEEKKRKTIGKNVGGIGQPNFKQFMAVLTESETEAIANALALLLPQGCKTKRLDKDCTHVLRYQIRTDYDKHRRTP